MCLAVTANSQILLSRLLRNYCPKRHFFVCNSGMHKEQGIMTTVTVTCVGDGSFVLEASDCADSGYLWGAYYSGSTAPAAIPLNPLQSWGNAVWTMAPYTPATNLSQTVTPPAGDGVQLAVWWIPNTSNAFNLGASAFVGPCSSSSSSTSSSSSSSSSSEPQPSSSSSSSNL